MLSVKQNKFHRLCIVDLDHTLIATDLLYEKIYLLLKTKPWAICLIPLYLIQGKVKFKQWLSRQVTLNFKGLPYRREILDRIRAARGRGEFTILLTASLQEEGDAVNKELRLFDAVVGSSRENFKGTAKLAYLKKEFAGFPFTYIGDSSSDLPLWREAEEVIAVNPSTRLKKTIAYFPRHEILRDRASLWSLTLKQIRVFQWPKNLLVFIPPIAAHSTQQFDCWWQALQAFAGFSLVASTVYLFNDLCDLEADRMHPSKRKRPLAAGAYPLSFALGLTPLLLLGTVVAVYALSWKLWVVLGIYLAANVAYSFWLKECLAIDVVVLAGFYTLRLLAGGAATQIAVSEWLLSFSVFFFFGLAMVKRFTELKGWEKMDSVGGGRRAYRVEDKVAVLVCGLASSFLSILVISLYLSTGEVKRLYHHPMYLWLLTPCLLYWLTRVWLLANRGEVDDDPVIFAFHDRLTWCVGLTCLAILVISI